MEANLTRQEVLDKLDIDRRRLEFKNTKHRMELEENRFKLDEHCSIKRLDLEIAWVLHRALGLANPPSDSGEEWKRTRKDTWSEEQEKVLLNKYYQLLSNL